MRRGAPLNSITNGKKLPVISPHPADLESGGGEDLYNDSSSNNNSHIMDSSSSLSSSSLSSSSFYDKTAKKPPSSGSGASMIMNHIPLMMNGLSFGNTNTHTYNTTYNTTYDDTYNNNNNYRHSYNATSSMNNMKTTRTNTNGMIHTISGYNRILFTILTTIPSQTLYHTTLILLLSCMIVFFIIPSLSLPFRILTLLYTTIALGIMGSLSLSQFVLGCDDGTNEMRNVSNPIREGAEGFLRVQYTVRRSCNM